MLKELQSKYLNTKESTNENNNNFEIFKLTYNRKIFLFGSIAAASAKTVIAPLDRTKIIIQISSNEFTFKRVFYILTTTYKNSGIVGLWKGHSASLVRVVPYGGIQFLTHEKIKSLFLYLNHEKSSTRLSSIERLLCGCITGIVGTIFTYPFDLIRTRMAVNQHNLLDSIIGTFKITLKNEGIYGLYRGLYISLIGILPYAGASFFTFETLKLSIIENRIKSNNINNNNHYNLCVYEKFLCGGIAGLIAQSCSYPFDVIRRMIQSDCRIIKNEYKFSNGFHAAKYILNNYGFISGFYKGLCLNWIKGPIATATSFTIFETLKQHFITS